MTDEENSQTGRKKIQVRRVDKLELIQKYKHERVSTQINVYEQ